jgi:2C-methyl-D-erythritol 2,4-cyclodiphosphate synthase
LLSYVFGEARFTGDIDDWFPDIGETDVKSIDYLPSIPQRLIEAHLLLLGTIDITILCAEQPRMKKRLAELQRNIAEGLDINLDQVWVKVSSMDGNDEIARLEGIEARVIVRLWADL